ncbi:sialate O-acetylesterase [Paenibacillus sp. HJGM_3]|uniref:sialate O-acetylesterase n=1 Tax=Paenibacillus sp. HJGM_3 TaxID=3379816 RepID=UPI00385C24B1
MRGAGLGVTFGKEILKETGVPVGLVMCAHGGTCMQQWDPDGLSQGGQSLYGSMIRRVQAVGGKVKGLLWYQGESDANPDHAPFYSERMERFVSALRRDLHDPKLPFVYSQLANFHSWNKVHECWWTRIRQEQLLLEERLSPSAMVATADSTLSDPIHLDAVSLQGVGRRFGRQALRLAYGFDVPAGPRLQSCRWNSDRTELTINCTGMTGKWMPVKRAFGFQLVVDDQDEWLPIDSRLSEDRTGIILQFAEPAPENASLSYGAGFYPAVNLKDEAGQPLPLFGPMPLP